MLPHAIAFPSTRSQKQLGIRQQTGRLFHPTRTAGGHQRQWIGGTNHATTDSHSCPQQRNIPLRDKHLQVEWWCDMSLLSGQSDPFSSLAGSKQGPKCIKKKDPCRKSCSILQSFVYVQSQCGNPGEPGFTVTKNLSVWHSNLGNFDQVCAPPEVSVETSNRTGSMSEETSPSGSPEWIPRTRVHCMVKEETFGMAHPTPSWTTQHLESASPLKTDISDRSLLGGVVRRCRSWSGNSQQYVGPTHFV